MYEFLEKLADILSKKYKLNKERLLKDLQHYFYPYEDKPKDTFLNTKKILSGFKL